MKKIIFLLFISSFLSSYSQSSIKLDTYFPAGDFAYPANISFGINFNYQFLDKYSKLRVFSTFGFIHYNITDKPMPYLTIQSGSLALPSEYTIEKFNSIPIGGLFEYKLLSDSKFSPIVGTGFTIDINSIKYHNYISTLIDDYFIGASYGYSLSAYAGGIYKMNDSLEMIARFGYRHSKDNELGIFSNLFLSISLTLYNY